MPERLFFVLCRLSYVLSIFSSPEDDHRGAVLVRAQGDAVAFVPRAVAGLKRRGRAPAASRRRLKRRGGRGRRVRFVRRRIAGDDELVRVRVKRRERRFPEMFGEATLLSLPVNLNTLT